MLLISLAAVNALTSSPVSIAIDLKPELGYDETRKMLQQAFDCHGRRELDNILSGLLPPKMASAVAALAGVSPQKQGHQIIAAEKEGLLKTLKCLRFNVAGPLSMAAATVTAGGVSLKEIEPRTMESKIIPGLYFCGEVMDIDADSGGYNLQAAFSTGYVAGESAAC